MGEKVIYISSEKKATPRVQDVLSSIAERAYPGTKIRFSTKIEDLESGSVLCFGKEKPEVNEGVQLIHTYSYPQIMSKRNAASVFKRSLELYFNGVDEPEFITFYEPKDLKRLNVAEPMALDIETGGDPFEEDMQEEVPLLSISFYQPGIAVALDTKDWNEQDYKQLTKYLLKVEKPIWHNGKFDLRVLKARTGVMFKQWTDTMLMHHVLNIGAGMHGLEELSALYFGCEDWSKELTKYTLKGAHYERIPTDLLLRYNALDVYYTYKLYEYLKPQIEENENRQKALMLEMLYSEYLLQIELNGMPINDKYIPDFEKILLERYHTSLGFVKGLAQDPEFNPNSPKQVKELLAQMGYEVNSTDEDSLTTLTQGVSEDDWAKLFVDNILGARKANKAYGTYLQGFQRRTRQGRVRTAFKIHGTVTGRLSSGNPNVQNIPRDDAIKRIIGYEPGVSDNIIMGVDYSQVELRVMAVLSQDEFLIESFQPGSEDFFLRLMYEQYGKSEVTKMPKKARDELRVQYKACVPTDTKILTKRGWLSWDEVRVGDETPALVENGKTEWSKITAVIEPFEDDIYSFGHSHFQFRCNDNHRWAVSSPDREEQFTLKPLNELGKYNKLHVSGRVEDPNRDDLTLNEVRIISWLLSDGHITISPYTGRTSQASGTRVGVVAGISQSDKKYWREIDELLKDVPHTKDYLEEKGIHVWRLKAAYARELLTRAGLFSQDPDYDKFILSLGTEQREHFLDAFWQAEGHLMSGTRVITQSLGKKQRAVQLCGTLLGYNVSVNPYKNKKDSKIVLKTRDYFMTQTAKKRLEGRGMVWCVQTEHGSWTAQQGRRMFITGNTVYGLSYGRGASAIAQELDIPVQQAQGIIDGIMDAAPKFKEWRERVHEAIRNPQKRELLTTVFGREAQAEIVTTRNINNLERELISFLPQSTASDLTVISAIRIMRTGELEKYGYSVINLVHDNIMLEGPRVHAEKVGRWVSYVMADTARRVLGDQVEFAAEPDWADNYGAFKD